MSHSDLERENKRLECEISKLTGEIGGLRLTVVARRLGCHVTFVKTLLHRGELRGFRLGGGVRGHWRVSERELERFIKERERMSNENR